MSLTGHNPDILTCLANLSADEVFTPPKLASAMLDILPQDLFRRPDTTFLDPFCKSGVFLREIARRLNDGLKDQMPDQQARINHILTKQVFGLATSELTALLSRRSVYCSKKADGKYSIATAFTKPDGNIRLPKTAHTWNASGKCESCGANQGEYDRDETLEAYAYPFIHGIDPTEVFNVKFDVIIGNPPYQLSDGGAQQSASPLYHHFVEQAKKLEARYLSMIIPSRWFAGGKGLDDFRKTMLEDKRISRLIDYPVAADVFPGIKLIGGVCYFLWERDFHGQCSVTTCMNQTENTLIRSLDKYKTFVRFNQALPILEKVLAKGYQPLSEQVSSRKPFGLPTTARPTGKGDVHLYATKTQGQIERELLTHGIELVDRWKVLLSNGYGEGGEAREYPRLIIGKPIVAGPPSACTETYIVVGAYNEENKALNLAAFLKTRLCRFLIALLKNTQHITIERFAFVPSPRPARIAG